MIINNTSISYVIIITSYVISITMIIITIRLRGRRARGGLQRLRGLGGLPHHAPSEVLRLRHAHAWNHDPSARGEPFHLLLDDHVDLVDQPVQRVLVRGSDLAGYVVLYPEPHRDLREVVHDHLVREPLVHRDLVK